MRNTQGERKATHRPAGKFQWCGSQAVVGTGVGSTGLRGEEQDSVCVDFEKPGSDHWTQGAKLSGLFTTPILVDTCHALGG